MSGIDFYSEHVCHLMKIASGQENLFEILDNVNFLNNIVVFNRNSFLDIYLRTLWDICI
jgi:hypothetical protein